MKILKWIMKAVVALVTIITLIVLFADDLGHTYNKLTWTPPMEINGIAIGMTRSDVVFKLGEPVKCGGDIKLEICVWIIDGAEHLFWFQDEVIKSMVIIGKEREWSSVIPFYNTTDMKALLGHEDLFGESKDFSERRYTYLKWGATFVFQNDVLTEYMVGEVRYRRPPSGGKYIVKGTIVCPGKECPFDDEGAVKEDFKDRDYTYFIK